MTIEPDPDANEVAIDVRLIVALIGKPGADIRMGVECAMEDRLQSALIHSEVHEFGTNPDIPVGLIVNTAVLPEGQRGAEHAELIDLIRHMQIHDNYPFNGYVQMTTPQKALYRTISGQSHDALMGR